MYDFEMKTGVDKTLVIFSGQMEGDDSSYGYEIDKIFKRRNTSYKDLIFLCPDYIQSVILRYIEGDSRLLSNLDRAYKVDQISFLGFNGYAELCLFKKIVNQSSSLCEDLKKLQQIVIEAGLLALVERRKDQVILKAPPGTIFEKPSKKKFHEFMKTSELSIGFSENQFVAFTLLAHRPKREDKNAIRNIWIDTSSISLFIEPLIYYIKKFNKDTYRTVKYFSFQSYGDEETVGYKTCIPDLKDDIWVIISASRSNSMGRDIYKVWRGLQHDQIVTVLSYSDTEYDQKSLSYTDVENVEEPKDPGDQIVVNISKYSDYHENEREFGSEVPVKIIGENFTVQVEDPNQVVLRKVHGPAEISSFIEPLNQASSFFVNKKHVGRLRSVYFDFERFVQEESKLKDDYVSWLRDIVAWYIPGSVGYVIYDVDDEASKLLFSDLKSSMPEIEIEEIDLKDVKDIDRDKAVVALMPVITRGNSLTKLNSDLRLLKHDAQRIYISPFATPHSKKEYVNFVKSLVMGPRKLKYNFLNFRKIFVGHQEVKNSWQRELDLVGRFVSPLWMNRTKVLEEQSKGISDAIGMSCDPNNDRLKFSIDFAFWGPDYNPEKVNPASVYLTVSAILQKLREKPYTIFDKESLFSHVYQHSILDPLNFSRFNDPLLQSCLWRCAYDGELDYRTPSDLSRKFVDILNRLASSRAGGDHNATLDLLTGIAIGKIRISQEYLAQLIESLTKTLGEFTAYNELIEYIDSTFNRPSSSRIAVQDAI